MFIFYHEDELNAYADALKYASEKSWPLMIDQYLPGTECELDCICDGEKVLIPGIFEHIEKAGVHSGDSMAVYPPRHLCSSVQETLIRYAEKICLKAKSKALPISSF